jgi:hypothetical protein
MAADDKSFVSELITSATARIFSSGIYNDLAHITSRAGMSVVQFGAVPCGCAECLGAVGAPASVGASHGGGHHLPPALKAHEFTPKPGDQRPHFPKTVDFAGPGKATFHHK